MAGEDPQQEWKRKTLEYVGSINAFVERGLRDGWEDVGLEPADPGRDHLADSALDAVRTANEKGRLHQLRASWPPANEPFICVLGERGQSIPVVHILPDKSIVARIGAPYINGKVVQIQGDSVTDLEDVEFFGVSPNRRFFGFATPAGVRVTDGWGGRDVVTFAWPKGTENIPKGFTIKKWETQPTYSRIIPFPDANRVLLVSNGGVFVVSPEECTRLLPTEADMKEHFKWLQEEYPDDDLTINLSMEHGSVSKNGKLIAIGSQDSSHLVFDETLSLIGEIGNRSDYPHCAIFSAKDDVIAFNSCHFYNGATVGVSVNLLPDLKTKPYEDDDRVALLEDNARVYAGVGLGDEFIIGDAYGYVRAFSTTGEPRWQLYVGSSIGDIDVSDDGTMMAVSTCAGYISIFELNSEQEPHQIGNSSHKEIRRWLFWKDEAVPLAW